jgi:dTDP-4-amino-4,6-dideoxygalactose transaminase
VFHYLPLHFSDMGIKYGGRAGDCPVTEDISDRLVRLPLFYNMTDTEQTRVIEEIRKMVI